MPLVTLTIEEYEDLREDCGGVCLSCGETCYDVEPDARRKTCEVCGEKKVYGAEELMLMGRVV